MVQVECLDIAQKSPVMQSDALSILWRLKAFTEQQLRVLCVGFASAVLLKYSKLCSKPSADENSFHGSFKCAALGHLGCM